MMSLILASHNGASTLPRTLDALTRVKRPRQGLEIIAVNNASTDESQALLEAYAAKLDLKVLVEPRQGKSFALNMGIEAAKGDLIVFTDDDVIPDDDWLIGYENAANKFPGAAVFAGQVRHEWDVRPPAWLEHLAAIGKSYAGTPVELTDEPVSPGIVKGCNFMVRRSALGATRFSEDPGTNFCGQGRSVGGEDTAFARELAEKGGEVRFAPDACLRHIVRKDQIGVWPVFSRYVRIGRTLPIEASSGYRILGYPVWGLRLALKHAGICLWFLLRGRTKQAAEQMIHFAKVIGGMSEGRYIKSNRSSESQAKHPELLETAVSAKPALSASGNQPTATTSAFVD